METRDRSSHLAFSPLAGHRKAGKNGGGQVSMQGRWKQQGILSIQGSEDAPSRHLQQATRPGRPYRDEPTPPVPNCRVRALPGAEAAASQTLEGAKRRGEEVRASWPQHEIAVRGHAWAEGAQNGREAEAEADGDGDGEGEKEEKAVKPQTVPYQLSAVTIAVSPVNQTAVHAMHAQRPATRR
ncbi:hypothetical protein TGAMA5MH_02309 [Trichoderma gamsii]|uniref:Uncharacterized protein n=1 Tax=Trichoderma gamsii TaxID=398673 RepID=A0A2K0TL75_9HYPO|nr:hypothetical protein TGAMA5MH_02309 [Trichoderma gamsii]